MKQGGATRREWIGLGVLALPCVLYAMDLTVLNLAVPKLTETLRPTNAELLWVIDIYGFLVAGSLLTMGTLGDRIGRRRLLLIGAAAFGITSVAAAFSTSAPALIASRAVLGLAGATLAPSTLSLIRNMFRDSDERSFAVGVWIASYSAGGAIGPLVGGLVLEHLWAGSVFLLGVPVMGVLLLLGPRLLPEFKDPAPNALDWPSAALSLASVLSIVFGLKRICVEGFAAAHVVAVLAGLALGAVFVRRQSTSATPLVDPTLFRSRTFVTALGTYSLATSLSFGVFVLISQHLQLVLGLSPLRAGLATAPFAMAFVVGSLLTPRIARRVRPVLVVAGGLVVASGGFAILTVIDVGSGLGPLLGGFVVFSLGLAPVFTLATDLVIDSVPPERAGVAAALSETGSELGGALGIAVFGSIAAAIFRGELARTLAGARGDSLGVSLAIASTLPAGPAAALAGAAREAFLVALRTVSTVAALISLALALVVLSGARRCVAGAEPRPMRNAPAGTT